MSTCRSDALGIKGGSHPRAAWMLAPLVLLGAAVLARAQSTADAPDDTPVGRFIAGLDERSNMPTDARDLIRKTWAECDECDGEEFLIQGLTLLSTRFRDALDAFDTDDYARAASVLAELRDNSTDPSIAANAAAYEIKALVQGERLVEALERVETVLTDGGAKLTTYSYLAPEIEFLRGYCLLADVRYAEAAAALEAFLVKYPDASQRLAISAQQMLLELKNRQAEQIGDVVDLMGYCGRRLQIADAGDTVQERQDRIVELLERMIDEAEQSEQQSRSSSGGGSGSNNSGNRSPSNPMQESSLPGGSPSDTGSLREMRRANPGETWGAMPPAERDRVLQALRDSFPQRYRRLVEQYYEELAKKP